MLKLELDNLSRKQLFPFDIKYQQLINETINASEEDRAKLNRELSDIDEKKIQISFGLEHIIREIGQLFEACESQPETTIDIAKHASQKIHYKELPKLACFLMMEGYPVEILDGEACSVPLLWVKNILKILPVVLRETDSSSVQESEVKVHVVSVLGIQSSGKSTFLNTIFGLQFAVSAGRCTRGAYMQGVKVHASLKEKIDADYLLAIDTEGLKAAELVSHDSRKHDNELSTFVIGLADTTVINLMGENATYLQENLPIAVHAFLRMNLAGLHPRCTIVHHNVDKRNKEKLLVQGRILESVLNRLTNKACELEKIPHKLFQDIIEFSISKHTDYIPALYEGEQPMAPVSVGYSKEAENVRKKKIEFVGSDVESSFSLSYFARHIENLWNAIKKDRFVYEFRTTLEAEAKLVLDQKYSTILMNYLIEIDNSVDSLIPKLTSKKQTYEQVEKKILKSISSIEKKCKEELELFISNPKRRAASCYEQWKEKCLRNLDDEMAHHRTSAIQQFRDHKQYLHFTISMDQIENFFDLLLKMSLSSKKSEEECFDQAWEKWAISSNIIRKDISVLRDTTKALHDVCPSHKHLIDGSKIAKKSIKEFKLSSEKHLNHLFHKFSETANGDLFTKMTYIMKSVEEEYMKEVNNIRWKKMPYTDRHPKRILLRVEHHLSGRLNDEDTQNEIANQFRIDLLVCLAGNILKDFEEIIQSDARLTEVKQNMKQLLTKRNENPEKSASELIRIIFEIMKKKIQSAFPSFAPKCVIAALKRSSLRNRVASKRALLGHFLYEVISDDEDDMLSMYVSSPKSAISQYLKIILKTVIGKKLFVPVLGNYIERILHPIRMSLEQQRMNDIAFVDIVESILCHADLDDHVEQLLRYNMHAYRSHKVNVSVVKHLLNTKFQPFINELTEAEALVIIEKENSIASVCADTLNSELIGCVHMCPLCKEICKYTFRHKDFFKHECFVHRPVGCMSNCEGKTVELSFETCTQHFELGSLFEHSGNHINLKQMKEIYPAWSFRLSGQRQLSLIWKWIFVNKYSVLQTNKSIDLPRKLPESWTSITRKDVLHAIVEQFTLSYFH